ncbi:MAG: tetratricopeptide repeat protein [Bacteroidetes bacterium]|nr:tetratricopeptide repeat protein [Bacteroidota bacterium]
MLYNTVTELGNKLLKQYCPDYPGSITTLTKQTFREMLIYSIALKTGIEYKYLPDEQVLYRAFRKADYSTATLEKLSFLYYACADSLDAFKIQKQYERLKPSQRAQYTPYWNRFVKDIASESAVLHTIHHTRKVGYEALNELALRRSDYRYWLRAAKNATELFQSIEILKLGLKELPDNPQIHKNLSVALNDAGRYAEEEKYILKALKANPHDADLHSNYGLHLHRVSKDYDKAEFHFREALRLCPEHINNNGHYAWFLHQIRNRYQEAQVQYEIALKTNSNSPSVLLNYSLLLAYHLFDLNKALLLLNRVKELLPNDPWVLGALAFFYTTYEINFDLAEQWYIKAINGDPNNYIKHTNYAQLLFIIGKTDQAMAELELAKKSKDISEESLLVHQFYLYCHRTKHWRNAKLNIQKMLDQGIASPHLNLTANLKTAIRDGHPEIETLLKYASLISQMPYSKDGKMIYTPLSVV